MGFFDDLNAMIGDISSTASELKQSTEEMLGSITESTEEIASLKDELTLDEKSADDAPKNQ